MKEKRLVFRMPEIDLGLVLRENKIHEKMSEELIDKEAKDKIKNGKHTIGK